MYKNVLTNGEVFENVKIQNDGYGIKWGDSLLIDYEELYKTGKEIDIELDAFDSYAKNNVIDTSETCELLGCTRQNIDDLQKRGVIAPLKENKKNKLFLKHHIESRLSIK